MGLGAGGGGGRGGWVAELTRSRTSSSTYAQGYLSHGILGRYMYAIPQRFSHKWRERRGGGDGAFDGEVGFLLAGEMNGWMAAGRGCVGEGRDNGIDRVGLSAFRILFLRRYLHSLMEMALSTDWCGFYYLGGFFWVGCEHVFTLTVGGEWDRRF